jgi:hypothetical protein
MAFTFRSTTLAALLALLGLGMLPAFDQAQARLGLGGGIGVGGWGSGVGFGGYHPVYGAGFHPAWPPVRRSRRW